MPAQVPATRNGRQTRGWERSFFSRIHDGSWTFTFAWSGRPKPPEESPLEHALRFDGPHVPGQLRGALGVGLQGAGNKILIAIPNDGLIERAALAKRAAAISKEKCFRFDLGDLITAGYHGAEPPAT